MHLRRLPGVRVWGVLAVCLAFGVLVPPARADSSPAVTSETPAAAAVTHRLTRADRRASVLRAQALGETYRFREARDELAWLTGMYPDDEEINLALAEAFDQTGEWPEAMRLYNRLALTAPERAAADQAYERRRDLRVERGNVIGFVFDGSTLSHDRALRYRPWLRYYPRPTTAVIVDGVFGRYRSVDQAPPSVVSRTVDEGGLEVLQDFGPNLRLGAFGRKYWKQLEHRSGYGVEGQLRFHRDGRFQVRAEKNRLWYEPEAAVINDGTMDVIQAGFSYPVRERWAWSAEGEIRQYRIFSGRPLGREQSGSTRLAYDLVRRPYGAAGPLRSITLFAGYERMVSHEDQQYLPVIALLPQTSTFTLGGDVHLLSACRTTIDAGAYAGQDSTRRLGFGKIYGLHGRVQSDLSQRVSVFAGAEYSSENDLTAQPGVYRHADAGINLYF